MRYYQEITLLPNPEVGIHFLWSKLYQQLHLGFVEMQDGHEQVPIGMSFPEYRMGDKYGILGNKCRLFAADEATLAHFDTAKWLNRLSDYVHWTSIKPVPEKITGHATYRRYQPKASKERLARRYAKYKKISYEEALQHYSSTEKEEVTLPFIRLKSLSKGQEFCLWIKKTPAAVAAGSKYGSYGLSATTTVPDF